MEENKIYGMEYFLKREKSSISSVMNGLTDFLIAKNKKYGNSALEPLKVFSKIEPENGICVRIDDKLSRLANATELRKNDIVDLTGYLVLLCTQKNWDNFEELIN